MKKLIILTLAAVSFTVASFGQQVPMYSHYYFNKFLYNPAMTGSTSYGQAYMLYRDMWNGVPDAPETVSITVDGPLKNKRVGLGFSLNQDRAAAFNSTSGKLSYRYGLQFSEESMLNFGLALGFLDNRIDFNRLRYKDVNDQYLNGNLNETETGFDATFGVNYTYKDLNIGLAVPQVLANDLAYESIGNIASPEVTYGLVRHFLASASYDLDINDNLALEPSVLVRATPGAPVQYDVNAMFNYDNKYWFGAMYRSGYAASVNAALRLFNQVVAGYSADFVINANRDYLRSAHEVMIGYQFGNTDDEELKKRFKGIDDKIKTNEDGIKKNREDIDSNDDDIDSLDKDKDAMKEELEGRADKLQKELDDLKSDFETFKKNVANGTIGIGDMVGFKNVYFETNKWDIRDVDVSELDNLISLMKENSNMSIGIFGHADMRGSDALNNTISRNRANSVRDYLISKGIESYRLRIEAMGEKSPASDNLDDNRRVEFKVLSK
jgi:type IX secretion system PorP/SprF family membrane protein